MKNNFTNNELKLLADLLEMASDEFGRHGCNDFSLKDYMTKEEAIEFCLNYENYNTHGKPISEEDRKYIEEDPLRYLPDFAIFGYFKHKIKNIIKENK